MTYNNCVRGKQRCRACNDLGFVTRGLYPDGPCPFCRTWLAKAVYAVMLSAWKRGLLNSRQVGRAFLRRSVLRRMQATGVVDAAFVEPAADTVVRARESRWRPEQVRPLRSQQPDEGKDTMRTIEMPGGLTILTTGNQAETDRLRSVMIARSVFVLAYCREHGWPEEPTALSIDQILEIRKQDGWKNPKTEP